MSKRWCRTKSTASVQVTSETKASALGRSGTKCRLLLLASLKIGLSEQGRAKCVALAKRRCRSKWSGSRRSGSLAKGQISVGTSKHFHGGIFKDSRGSQYFLFEIFLNFALTNFGHVVSFSKGTSRVSIVRDESDLRARWRKLAFWDIFFLFQLICFVCSSFDCGVHCTNHPFGPNRSSTNQHSCNMVSGFFVAIDHQSSLSSLLLKFCRYSYR